MNKKMQKGFIGLKFLIFVFVVLFIMLIFLV